MNKKLLFSLAVLCILAFVATTACAIDFRTERFALLGTGSFMNHPPIISGQIIGGTLYPGTFWIAFDDTGWPVDNPATPGNERMEYVFNHYFHYDPTVGGESWDGYFPPTGSGEPAPRWRFYTDAGDTLGGSFTSALITILDLNANGIMEESEYNSPKLFSGNLIAYINYSSGCFHNFCGSGSMSGNLNVINPQTLVEELYIPSAALPSGRLNLRNGSCTVGVEPASWGHIKSIYR